MRQLAFIPVMVALFTATSVAHHSAVQFDFTRSETVTGVVKKFRAINPHCSSCSM